MIRATTLLFLSVLTSAVAQEAPEFAAQWSSMVQAYVRTSYHGDQIRGGLRAGDSRAIVLQRLGFGIQDRIIAVPEVVTVIENYEGMMAQAVVQGRITAEDIIHPDASPNRAVEDVVRSGFFPLSHDERAFHDLAHLTGFAEHPEYMAALRQLARSYGAGDDRPSAKDRGQRFFFFLEAFSAVPESKREALRESLSPYFKKVAADQLTKVSEVIPSLRAMDPAALKARARLSTEACDKLANHYGGTSRELGEKYGDTALKERLSFFQARVGAALLGNHHTKLAEAVARLEVALWESTKITPALYASEAAKKDPGPSSPLFRYFVETGISRGMGEGDSMGLTAVSFGAPVK